MNAHRTITRSYAGALAALGLAGAAVGLAPAPASAVPYPYRHGPASVERARMDVAVSTPLIARPYGRD